MLPDRVSNPGPQTYESGALPIALRGPAPLIMKKGIYAGLKSVKGILRSELIRVKADFAALSVFSLPLIPT